MFLFRIIAVHLTSISYQISLDVSDVALNNFQTCLNQEFNELYPKFLKRESIIRSIKLLVSCVKQKDVSSVDFWTVGT